MSWHRFGSEVSRNLTLVIVLTYLAQPITRLRIIIHRIGRGLFVCCREPLFVVGNPCRLTVPVPRPNPARFSGNLPRLFLSSTAEGEKEREKEIHLVSPQSLIYPTSSSHSIPPYSNRPRGTRRPEFPSMEYTWTDGLLNSSDVRLQQQII